MVLGQMVAAHADPIVGLDQLQPVLVMLAQRHRAEVEMVEDAELHMPTPRCPNSPRDGSYHRLR